MESKHHMTQIPEEFYSFETKGPFTQCLECEKPLMDGQPYLIEKAFKNHVDYGVKETVFDYALCLNCVDNLRDQMSPESMAAITHFFTERIDPLKAGQKAELSPEENIGSCLLSGRNMNDCSEYQIYAYCINDKLSYEMPPYMISGQIMDEIIPLLSQKTTDDLNGFFNRHFAPDPSLMEPIGPKFVLV